MKPLLVALTAISTTLPGIAAAEISLFGDARLGLGYNIFNDGDFRLEERRRSVPNPNFDPAAPVGPDNPERVTVVTSLRAPNDLRAVSRVRFGVNMTGESDAGITFGASIRADNAGGGQGGATGQRSGNVFVSGAFGTLTYGDVDGADYNRVGDPIGNASLTGLDDTNELPFISNAGGSDNDALQFLAPSSTEQRPTVRYDYDIAGFGLSVSTNRDLNAVGVGASYMAEFDGGSVTLGAGYYDFQKYDVNVSGWGAVRVPNGNQWSASLRGKFGAFQGGIGYTSLDLGSTAKFDVLTGGVGATYDALTVLAFYSKVTKGDNLFGEALDKSDSYGASLGYNLGGGLRLSAGIARSYSVDAVGVPGATPYKPELEAATVADFGLNMRF